MRKLTSIQKSDLLIRDLISSSTTDAVSSLYSCRAQFEAINGELCKNGLKDFAILVNTQTA
jgi:hypothetical protein